MVSSALNISVAALGRLLDGELSLVTHTYPKLMLTGAYHKLARLGLLLQLTHFDGLRYVQFSESSDNGLKNIHPGLLEELSLRAWSAHSQVQCHSPKRSFVHAAYNDDLNSHLVVIIAVPDGQHLRNRGD